MPTVQCSACVAHNDRRSTDDAYRYNTMTHDPRINIQIIRGDAPELSAQVRLEGIIICLDDGQRRPIKLVNNMIDETGPTMPVNESSNLIEAVPDGIKQDIEEAERDHFSQSYKSSVIMCRRAMQLGLVDKGISDGPLTRMLDKAKSDGVLNSDRAYAMAQGIKDFGDAGAHRTEILTDSQVRTVIYASVNLLNDIYA